MDAVDGFVVVVLVVFKVSWLAQKEALRLHLVHSRMD